jgi:His/Glu/Gln/Arg/opine family amino acid ABC transporter permease subunit
MNWPDWTGEIIKGLPIFGEGLKTSLILFALSGSIGFLLGCFFALAKARYIPRLYSVAWLYVELFRNLPLLVILFLFYYAFQLNAYVSGLLALIGWCSAFSAEIIRAGIESLPSAQIQAARLLGVSRSQLIFNLVLPQAIIRMLPVLANQFMNLVKNTSIVYFVGVLDITYAFEQLSAEHFLFFQFFFVALAIYMTLCLIIIYVFKFLEYLFRGEHIPRVDPEAFDNAVALS